jgi:hypothetical protein
MIILAASVSQVFNRNRVALLIMYMYVLSTSLHWIQTRMKDIKHWIVQSTLGLAASASQARNYIV